MANHVKLFGRDIARQDFKRLKQQRRIWRDRRYKYTAVDRANQRYAAKLAQFNMLLHRRGLRSPYDYEYPRMDQMNQLAREFYDRHLSPWDSFFTVMSDIEEILQWV
jgi:hypothetical protein